MTELHIQKRAGDVKPAIIREEGNIPAVFYGAKEESTPIMVSASEFVRVWDEAGSSAIISLVGVDDAKDVLIHEVDVDPVSGHPLHVDFYCIEAGKTVTVTVPLVFVGEAPAEKLGGIVAKAMHEIEIEVQPRDIPHEIEVDLSRLTDLDSTLTIADLGLAAGIETSDDPDTTIASIVLPQEESQEERDISDVEIEGEKKEEEQADEPTE